MARIHTLVFAAIALALPTATANAQDPLGILNRTDTSFTSRGSNTTPNTNPSVAFVRIDKEAYAGWGVDPANPGMREIRGISGVIQDQIGNTPETYDLMVYTEDPASPDFPLIGTPQGMVTGLPTPPSGLSTAAVHAVNATFATPMLTPASGDTFLGIGLPQPTAGTWPADGLSLHALYYVMVSSGTYDVPGGSHPTSPPQQGNGGWYVASSPFGPTYTVTPRQWKLEPIIAGATGVAGTITNQTGAPLSNVAPGTSSMGSGLFPDATTPPLNTGRMDDIVSRWFMSSAPNNTAVFFLASFRPFGPEVPLSSFTPGAGNICLDITSVAQLGIGFTVAGEAFFPWNMSPTARTFLQGVGITHQSIGLDPSTGFAYANPCTRQTL